MIYLGINSRSKWSVPSLAFKCKVCRAVEFKLGKTCEIKNPNAASENLRNNQSLNISIWSRMIISRILFYWNCCRHVNNSQQQNKRCNNHVFKPFIIL